MSIHPDDLKKLLGLRPEKADSSSEPDFSAALEAAAQDPNLEALRREEEAFDKEFADSLKTVAPPATLRESIFQAYEAEFDQEKKVISFTNWLYGSSFAAAAAILLMLVLNFTFWNPPVPGPAIIAQQEVQSLFSQAYSQLRENGPRMKSQDYNQLASFIQTNGAYVPTNLPSGLSREKGFACDVFSVNGIDIALICFKEGEQIFHVFSIDKRSMAVESRFPTPQIKTEDNKCCATWEKEDRIFHLVSEAPEEKVRQLLEI